MDIHYIARNGELTIIADGTEIFYELFKHDYKQAYYANFIASAEKNKLSFFNLMNYFTHSGGINYINTELLYCIRERQLQFLDKRRQSAKYLGYLRWAELKQLEIPVYDNVIFTDYIILPLLNCEVRLADLKMLYCRIVNDKSFESDYELTLKSLHSTLKLCVDTDIKFSTVTAMPIIYDMIKSGEDITPIKDVMNAYSEFILTWNHRYSRSNYGFPTIDNLVKQVAKCKSEDRNKLSAIFVNACRQKDATLLGAHVDSSVPGSWQVAMATKKTILNEFSWNDLRYVLDALYPNVRIERYGGGYIDYESIVGATFKRLTKNKNIEEFLDILHEWFKEKTGKDLTTEVLKEQLAELRMSQDFLYNYRLDDVENILYHREEE